MQESRPAREPSEPPCQTGSPPEAPNCPPEPLQPISRRSAVQVIAQGRSPTTGVDRELVKLIDAIKSSHPSMERLYREGQCYNFFRIIRSVRPTAVAWYSMSEGHVYTQVGRAFYDIRGYRPYIPADLHVLDHRHGDRPHRWGKRDRRTLTDLSTRIDAILDVVRDGTREFLCK